MTTKAKTQTTEKTAKPAKREGVHMDRVTETIDAHADDRFVCKEQRAFLQLVGPGGQQAYFALGKPLCRRVDLTFVPPGELGLSSVIPVRAPNGAVVRELDTGHASFLDDLATLLEWMKTAPPVVKERRQAFAPTLPVIAQRSPLSAEDRAAKRRLIEEVSRQHGVAISPGVAEALGGGEGDDSAPDADLADIPEESWDEVAASFGE
jgi:hypothetical protein